MNTEQETPGALLARILEACQDVNYEVPLSHVLEGLPNELNRAKYYIVAMNYRCFTSWCNKVGISPKHRMLRYISDGQGLMGLSPENAVLIEVCGEEILRHPNRHRLNLYREMRLLCELGVKLVYEHC